MRLLPLLALVAACATQRPPADDDAEVSDPVARGRSDTTFQEIELDLAERLGDDPTRIVAHVHAPDRADGPARVILWNHGFATETEQYFRLGDHLASWGFVVVMPQWDLGATSRTHVEIASDARLALDWIVENGLPLEDVEIETRVFGAGGHSRGGKQALLHAGADDRVGSVFNLDPVDALPPFGDFDPADYPSAAPEVVSTLDIPLGHVGAGRGPDGVVPCAPEGDNYVDVFAAARPFAIQYELPTAGHADFTDDCSGDAGGVACNLCPAGDDPASAALFGRAAAVAFFARTLRDDASFGAWLEGDEAPAEVVPDVVRSVKE